MVPGLQNHCETIRRIYVVIDHEHLGATDGCSVGVRPGGQWIQVPTGGDRWDFSRAIGPLGHRGQRATNELDVLGQDASAAERGETDAVDKAPIRQAAGYR